MLLLIFFYHNTRWTVQIFRSSKSLILLFIRSICEVRRTNSSNSWLLLLISHSKTPKSWKIFFYCPLVPLSVCIRFLRTFCNLIWKTFSYILCVSFSLKWVSFLLVFIASVAFLHFFDACLDYREIKSKICNILYL